MGLARSGAAAAAALSFALAAAARADDVTLSAIGGGLEISGTLRSFDGVVYRVDTVWGLLTLDASAVTCAGPGCPDLVHFVPRLTVAGEAYPGAAILAALVADYAAATGAGLVRIEDPQGFTLSLAAAGGGLAEIRFLALADAGAVRAALAEGTADVAVVADAPGEAGGRLLAFDTLLPVVWPGNPLRQIGLHELRAVQAGAIASWAELGGPDMPVVLHALPATSGLGRMIADRLGAPPPHGAAIHPDPAALAAAVARDPWALALVPASKAAGLRTLLVTDGCGHLIRPGRFAVKAEDYPLVAAIHLVAPQRRPPAIARALAEHAATATAQSAIAAAGFADLAAEVQAVTEQGGRLVNAIRAAGPEVTLADLQRLVAAMTGAERLSLTFRFEGGARALDAASRTHLVDIARLIEAGLLDGREIVFAGFSDGDGDARANLALSQARAEAVRDAVAAEAVLHDPARLRFAAEGFGEALPIACDDTPTGRQVNRRVEVWLRPLTDSQPRGN
jgi:phosphate transport system substrate-binding protein